MTNKILGWAHVHYVRASSTRRGKCKWSGSPDTKRSKPMTTAIHQYSSTGTLRLILPVVLLVHTKNFCGADGGQHEEREREREREREGGGVRGSRKKQILS